jgi:hypothetical protein
MLIQQVINASPITGRTSIPGAGEKGGTSERRDHVMPGPEPAPPLEFPPDMLPPSGDGRFPLGNRT